MKLRWPTLADGAPQCVLNAVVTDVSLLQGFAGLALLAISALSTILNILGGLTLGMAWIGLVVYFMTGELCHTTKIPPSNAVCKHKSVCALSLGTVVS